MNDQPPVAPVAPVAFGPAQPLPPPRNALGMSVILIGVLALGTIGFGLAFVSASGQAHTAKANLNSAKQAAAINAQAAQKQSDEEANTLASESPYRAYTAPNEFGSFVINFPKNWDISVDQEENSTNQVTLVLQPNFVRTINGVDDLAAAKITLMQKPIADYLKTFNVKKVTQTNVTVSGIAAVQLTGTFSDTRVNRIVVVPVRDKIIIFDNEDKTYVAEFNTILAQAKINP